MGIRSSSLKGGQNKCWYENCENQATKNHWCSKHYLCFNIYELYKCLDAIGDTVFQVANSSLRGVEGTTLESEKSRLMAIAAAFYIIEISLSIRKQQRRLCYDKGERDSIRKGHETYEQQTEHKLSAWRSILSDAKQNTLEEEFGRHNMLLLVLPGYFYNLAVRVEQQLLQNRFVDIKPKELANFKNEWAKPEIIDNFRQQLKESIVSGQLVKKTPPLLIKNERMEDVSESKIGKAVKKYKKKRPSKKGTAPQPSTASQILEDVSHSNVSVNNLVEFCVTTVEFSLNKLRTTIITNLEFAKEVSVCNTSIAELLNDFKEISFSNTTVQNMFTVLLSHLSADSISSMLGASSCESKTIRLKRLNLMRYDYNKFKEQIIQINKMHSKAKTAANALEHIASKPGQNSISLQKQIKTVQQCLNGTTCFVIPVSMLLNVLKLLFEAAKHCDSCTKEYCFDIANAKTSFMIHNKDQNVLEFSDAYLEPVKLTIKQLADSSLRVNYYVEMLSTIKSLPYVPLEKTMKLIVINFSIRVRLARGNILLFIYQLLSMYCKELIYVLKTSGENSSTINAFFVPVMELYRQNLAQIEKTKENNSMDHYISTH